MRWLVMVVAVTACIEPGLVPCGDQLCPRGLECTLSGCATPDQVAACVGKPEHTPCAADLVPAGYCVGGACRASVCGNAVVEDGEVCDDGNLDEGDGCGERCDSNETCGNTIVDFAAGEECDNAIAGLSSDGCSSRCTSEIDLWLPATPRVPSTRAGHQLVWDPDRKVVVMFGGRSETGMALDDTWTWDGVVWEPRAPIQSPAPRYEHVMVYDRMRRRVVLFGGHTAAVPLDDTWEWNGTTWTERTPAVRPTARFLAAGAWDDDFDVVVLHGGADVQQIKLDDTWTYDGTAWTQRAPARSPGPLAGGSMAYDPVRMRAVLFGCSPAASTYEWDGSDWSTAIPGPQGCHRSTLVFDPAIGKVVRFGGVRFGPTVEDAETWVWEGTGWTQQSPASSPPSRRNHGGAYDELRASIVMFGGSTQVDPKFYGDTWTYAAGTWSRVTSTSPGERGTAGAAYDASRGLVVMFGGVPNDESWIWNGSVWRPGPTGPSARLLSAMAYDEARTETILFSSDDSAAETWILGDVAWSQRTGTQPPRRAFSALAYDSVRQVAVLFGGMGLGSIDLGDTWEWNGTGWLQRSLPTSPPATSRFGLAFDRARGLTVLYGGSQTTDQTWEYDGVTWTQRSPATSPPGFIHPALSYDPMRRRIVLVSPTGQTWEWDGVAWSQRLTLVTPVPRSHPALVYDAVRASTFMYGGNGSEGILADTWTYQFLSLYALKDRCIDVDTDGDGLAGCADPDCWARCTPFCPPGTTACDPARPRCGDASCSPLEDYLLCAQDCPEP